MSWAFWLAIPVVATLIAVGWVAWIQRTRGPADPLDTIDAHRRFRTVLGETSRDGED